MNLKAEEKQIVLDIDINDNLFASLWVSLDILEIPSQTAIASILTLCRRTKNHF